MTTLLDTDVCIHVLRGHEAILARFKRLRRMDVAISVITECELRVGAARSHSPAQALRRVDAFLEPIEILEFTSADAALYGKVRSHLDRARTPIGPLDTLIAAQAVSRGLILATGNVREFRRVAGLQVDDWAV